MERHRELEKRVAQKRLIAAIPREERRGQWDHLRKAIGGMLIALGERLNPAERQAGTLPAAGADDYADTVSLRLAR